MKWWRGKTPGSEYPSTTGDPVLALPSKQLLIARMSGLYDPATDSYRWLPDLTPKFTRHVPWNSVNTGPPLLLADGRTVLIPTTGSVDVYLLDTLTGSSKMAAPMVYGGGPNARPFLLPSGKVLIVGATKLLGLYDPIADAWTPSSTPTGFMGTDVGDTMPETASMAQLPDGDVLVTGTTRDCAKAYRYRWRDGVWSTVASLPASVAPNRSVLLLDGRVFVAGGARCGYGDAGMDASDRSFVYDPALDAWSERARLNQRRQGNGLVRLPCGRVLAISGYEAGYTGGPPTLGLELYDPIGDVWHVVRSKPDELEMSDFLQPENAMLMPEGGVMTFGVIKVKPGAPPAYCDDCQRTVVFR